MRIKEIFLILFSWLIFLETYAQDKSIHIKYFVKQNEVLLRWLPANKQLFDLAVKNGYKITRYSKENNSLSLPIILAENIKPFAGNDSIKWPKLIRKNKNAILIYQSLYQNKNSSNMPAAEKAEQQQMLYNMMLLSCDFSAEIALSCGLFFRDSTAGNTKTYSYKIEINKPPVNLKAPSSSMEVNAAILSTNPPINNLTGEFKNKKVDLRWKATDFTNYYGGYHVERSADSILYKQINNSPVILLTSQFEKKKEMITYTDTLPTTKTKYYYRIKGINNFGEESTPSNMVSGIGYDELRSNPLIDSIKVIGNRKIFIRWKMKDEKENDQPKEYILLRSEKDKGPYSTIYASKQFIFTDETPKATNYYKIGAVSLGHDTLYSYSRLALIIDTIPPSVPTGVQAKSDPKGNVTITWTKNPEADVQGYKIFKSNSLTEEFVQINEQFARTPTYSDKLNLGTLSKKIYYSIVATDNNFNNSELSAPIEVKRPDTIAPVPAMIKDMQIKQNGIKLFWIPSSSDDVRQYTLVHQDEKTKTDIKIKEWKNSDSTTSFLDTVLAFGIGYRFKIITMDEDSNHSVSNTPYMFFETGFRKKITDVKVKTDRTKRSITLEWNYPEKEIEKFIIYRGKKNEPLTIIKTLASPASFFEDNTPNIGNNYEYRIKAVFQNGAESIISDASSIEF